MGKRLAKFDPDAQRMAMIEYVAAGRVVDVKKDLDLGDLVAAGRVVPIYSDLKNDFDAFETVNAVGPLSAVEVMIEKAR